MSRDWTTDDIARLPNIVNNCRGFVPRAMQSLEDEIRRRGTRPRNMDRIVDDYWGLVHAYDRAYELSVDLVRDVRLG